MVRGDAKNPPAWLMCKKALIPDMVATDVRAMPVWEITGAEFSKSDHHTADGISIRFPRITRQREDKTTAEATTLKELNALYVASKDCTNLQMLTDGLADDDCIEIKTKIQHKIPSPIVAVKQEKDKSIKSEPSDVSSIERKHKINAVNDEKMIKKLKHDDGDGGGTDDDYNKASTNKCNSNSTAYCNEKKEKTDKYSGCVGGSGGGGNPDIIVEQLKKPSTAKQPLANKLYSSSSSSSKNNAPPGSSGRNDASSNSCAKNSEINFFETVTLYVSTEVREHITEELRYFQLWGGRETSSPKKCTHHLHKNATMTGDWSNIRYKP